MSSHNAKVALLTIYDDTLIQLCRLKHQLTFVTMRPAKCFSNDCKKNTCFKKRPQM